MKPEKLTIYERALRVVGHTGLPGVHGLVNRLAPRHQTTRWFETEFFGLDYRGDLLEFIDRSIFYFGAYAPGELEFLQHCAKQLSSVYQGIGFFDLGANVGQHSIFMSRLVSHVHGFEPSARVADQFAFNVSSNNLRNVHIHRVALGDEDGEADLGSGFPGNTGSRSLNWSLPGKATERVSVRDAGLFLKDKNLPRMHILKIDVEGHEKKVLKSLSARLKSDRPVIMIELIGKTEKGGFASMNDFRETLYPRHELRSLKERWGRYKIIPFSWECECAVVIPSEVVGLLVD
jgi:FkbM family methyltransferase